MARGRVFGVILAACNAPERSLATSEWGTSGVAVIEGVALDTSRAPLDSVRVFGGIEGGQALYYTFPSISTSNGRFSVRVERRGAGPLPLGDSVRMVLNAESLKTRDRKADGTSHAISQQVWLRFQPPPNAPYSVPMNISLPFAR
jgi:hypothetical protein